MTKAFTPEELKHIRDELKLSTREVGYLCNISNQTVCNYENGSKHVNKSMKLLITYVLKEYIKENE